MSSSRPPPGRLARLGKLASLSAKVSTGIAARAAAKALGRDANELQRQATERVAATLGELKGAAMKLGQALSMDPDALPPELRGVLARLQNQAPPVAYPEIAAVVAQELGGAPEEKFAEFERAPVAAASLGQVHRARLRDGREVAVKVQYPGMVEAIESDFANLGLIVNAVGRTTKTLDGREYYEEFRREISLETDYEREALLAGRYRELVSVFPDLCVPEVVASHSTRRVLTLEFIHGQTLQQFVTSSADNAARMRVSSQLIRAIYGPFLRAGEVHADPHPGNFLVTEDGRLAILDFGSVKVFSPSFTAACRGFFRDMVSDAPLDLLQAVRDAGFRVELPDEQARVILDKVQEIVGRSARAELFDYAADRAGSELRELRSQHLMEMLRIRPPAEGVMFARAIGGCGQNLRALGARGDFRVVWRALLPFAS